MGIVKKNDATWFVRQPVDYNLLGRMMEHISECAGLSQRYTNHCVWATCMTVLKEGGVEDGTICAVTGHKNKRSLASYSKPRTCQQKLSRCLDGNRATVIEVSFAWA